MPLEDIHVPKQVDNVPSQNNSMQSTPEKNVRPAVASPEKCVRPSEKNVRPAMPIPSTNPFLAPIDIPVANYEEESPSLPNIPPPVTNQSVISPPRLPLSPLPPIPPRQRSFRSSDPIRIPIHLVRPNKQESAKKTADVINNNSNSTSPTTILGVVVPEIHETSQQNGNGYFNGDHHSTIENDTNNHELPCPCKSGAHPKPATKCQENGYERRPSLPRNLCKCLDFQYFNLFMLFYFKYTLVCFFMNVACLPSPPKGQVVAVKPMHVLAHDHVYVQFAEYSTQFNDVQFNMLQKIRPKPLNCTPSM